MTSISKLASKFESVTLAQKAQHATVAGASPDNCPLILPHDIVTHHLIPQLANPAVLLEPSDPVIQVQPSSEPLRTLAATSKRFRTLVSGQYKTYLQCQYPAIHSDILNQASVAGIALDKIDWFSRAIQAEKLCNRWFRRQFYVSVVPVTDPVDSQQQLQQQSRVSNRNNNNHHHHHNSNNVNGRRTPYSPRMDVFESLSGKETLALGQGTQLAVRVGEYAPWRVIIRKGMVPGADDIHNVHIYDEDNVIASRSIGFEVVRNVTGRDRDALRISQTNDLFESGVRNPTGGVTSSCLDPSVSANRPFVITTTSPSNDDHKLQIFTVSKQDSDVRVSKAPVFESVIPSKSWTSTFLTPTVIAAGHRTGLSLYELTQSYLSAPINIPQPDSIYDHDIAVHSLTRLSPPFSQAILASGWSDGITRLLDTRTNTFVASYMNPISNESAPVYALCHTSPLSNNLLAGSSMHHALEVHDLRYTGDMVTEFSPLRVDSGRGVSKADLVTDGCLLFFDSVKQNALDRRRNTRTSSKSVYSLGSAGAGSGKVYIGVENSVIEMDFRKRVQGRRWGMGLSTVEKVRKKAAEKEKGHMVPMYWFDREKQRRKQPEDVDGHWDNFSGRWWCGNGRETYRVRERNRANGMARTIVHA
ncbi:hypothetical protein ABW20_dc0104698 [Dactylellina cionopaga]|nr:hypothetical protein ABW20_dc0104698 [Dactylellina cionopaga]